MDLLKEVLEKGVKKVDRGTGDASDSLFGRQIRFDLKNNLSKILGERLLKVSDIHDSTGISRSTLTHLYYQRTTNIQLETLTKIHHSFTMIIDYAHKCNVEGKKISKADVEFSTMGFIDNPVA